MAGGPHAFFVLCPNCAGRAKRVNEGTETDQYSCESCNYKYGIDWSYDGPPKAPCWPPTSEELEAVKKMIDMKRAKK